MVGAVVEGPTAALRVAGSIPPRNKIFVWPTGSCSGSVCVCTRNLSMFANTLMIQELFLVAGQGFFF